MNFNDKSTRVAVGVIAGIALSIALGFIYWQTIGPSFLQRPMQKWFYDLNTGKLFLGPGDAIAPIPAPSGALPDGSLAGVLAHVYSCGECTEKERVVAYLETCSPAAQARIKSLQQPGQHPMPTESMRSGILLKRPGDAQWIEHDTPEATKLLDEVLPLCPNGAAPQPCMP